MLRISRNPDLLSDKWRDIVQLFEPSSPFASSDRKRFRRRSQVVFQVVGLQNTETMQQTSLSSQPQHYSEPPLAHKNSSTFPSLKSTWSTHKLLHSCLELHDQATQGIGFDKLFSSSLEKPSPQVCVRSSLFWPLLRVWPQTLQSLLFLQLPLANIENSFPLLFLLSWSASLSQNYFVPRPFAKSLSWFVSKVLGCKWTCSRFLLVFRKSGWRWCSRFLSFGVSLGSLLWGELFGTDSFAYCRKKLLSETGGFVHQNNSTEREHKHLRKHTQQKFEIHLI